LADYCSVPLLYNDTLTNTTGSSKNGAHMWNDSVIHGGTNLEPLSLVINDSYGDYRYINVNFMCKNDKRNILVTVGKQRTTVQYRMLMFSEVICI
jgi:hypothetical protein